MIWKKAFLASLCVSSIITIPAQAHGLLMKLRSEGVILNGELFYSNGVRASGEWITIIDQDDAGTPTVFQTNEKGEFQHEAIAGHRYNVQANGDEGHEIIMEITAGQLERGRMQEADAIDNSADNAEIPAWALIGGALITSIIPALWIRRRDLKAEREANVLGL